MKFYLVDKYDNINTTAVLDSGVGLSGARTYFLGIKKLDEKNCDWLIANDVSNKNIGFDSEYNEVKIFQKNSLNIENISFNTKEMIAKTLVKKIANELKANG